MPADHLCDYVVRPMRVEDAAAVERLSDEAYHDLDVRTHRPGWPEPERRSPAARARWAAWATHLVRTDPGGSWVAEDDSGVIGASASIRRDTTWILSSFAVRPGLQGRGVGRQLLDAALSHGRGCLRGLIASSDDPAAVRRYRLAGFTLHPTMVLRGRVDRAVLPVVERVRAGSLGDVDLMDSVDRQVRDSAHGPDHEVMAAEYRIVVADRSAGQGYAYLRPDGTPYLLAATNRRTATDLLWEALAATSPDAVVEVPHVTAANQWAVDVGLAARLDLHTSGYLGVRHAKPPLPYLHSGRFL
ncbi:MAG TPA: GNAT family N-acetyltransferase [Nocardioides sp.]|nr:GNAT family N-acetyltransferase [Nocardioides sp.]